MDSKRQSILQSYDLDLELAGVGELHGSVSSMTSVSPTNVVDFFEEKGSLAYYPESGKPGWEGIDVIRESDGDVLVETTPTDIKTGEPALSHIRLALSRQMHVVSANKGPFIRSYRALKSLANDHSVTIKLSAAAAAALPTLDVAQTCLAGTEIQSIEGVLNGTSNFILTRIRKENDSFESALAEAQRLGIAETDPTLDIEGYDTANKLALIANVAMDLSLLPENVDRQGIVGIDCEQIRQGSERGMIMRLVGRAERIHSGGVRASVAPELLPLDHPLASVDGTEKGITYTTDTMDRITVMGGKSDPMGAAAALLKDLINIFCPR
jgi:homoserine dehydrogenase